MNLLIYTDGACATNPGRGGWAYIIIRDGVTTEASGAAPSTTNNRMELQAAIEALKSLTEPTACEVVSDSQYLVHGMKSWLRSWKSSGWETARHKPVANREQWEELDHLCQIHRVAWRWVQGHSGDQYNERCDLLANREAGIQEDVQPWWQRAKAAKKLRGARADSQRQALRRAMLEKISGAEAAIRALREVGLSWRQLAEEYDVPSSLIVSVVEGRDLDEWVREF